MTEELPASAGAGDPAFANEVSRVRGSGVFGESGRLRELFDFLAARGLASHPASQAEIAEEVFGQVDSDGDDATVRVYVHRLRKRLDQFYDQDSAGSTHGRLTIPAGSYALRLAAAEAAEPSTFGRGLTARTWLVIAVLAVLVSAAFLVGRLASGGIDRQPVNAIWRPFVESERPILVVVGDYYMFGEIDPLAPENGRLIRDFRIDSPADLVRAQVEEPARYGSAEDVGLTYLPLSSADALRALMPILAHDDKPVQLVPASKLDSRMLSDFNVVYVGLVSGMGLLEDVSFMSSNLAVGETYDELVHLPSDGRFISGEAQSLPLPGYYTDYGYFSVFRAPGGGLVAVVAGARDTALRAIAPIVAGADLPEQLQALADNQEVAPYEALFEITGQQGADLNDRVVLAARRPGS